MIGMKPGEIKGIDCGTAQSILGDSRWEISKGQSSGTGRHEVANFGGIANIEEEWGERHEKDRKGKHWPPHLHQQQDNQQQPQLLQFWG